MMAELNNNNNMLQNNEAYKREEIHYEFPKAQVNNDMASGALDSSLNRK